MQRKRSLSVNTALHSSSGFSLIELLVAAFLGLIVIGAFFQLYLIDIKISHEAEAEVLREDELRFLHLTLLRLVENAGYVGPCSGRPQLAHDTTLNGVENFISPFIAYSKQGLKNAASGMRSAISHPKSEVLFVQYLSDDAKPLDVYPINGEDDLVLPKIAHVEVGDIMMLADCEQAVIFPVLAYAHGAVRHVDKQLGIHAFREKPSIPTVVGHFVQQAIYLGDTQEKNAKGEYQKAIFLKDLKSNIYLDRARPADALMVGVSDFKMVFSQHVGNSVVWRSAEGITNWHAVSGVKFTITLPPISEGASERVIKYIFARRNGMSPR